MNLKKMITMGLLVVGLCAVSVIGAGAKGPSDWVEFQMPGMYRNIRLELPDVPEDLSFGQFEDFLNPIQGPDNLGPGFMITRGWFDDQGKAEPWDRVMYFANLEGDLGYVYYFGIVNGSSEYDGRWFQVSEAGQAALIDVLDSEGVHIAGINPGAYYTFGDGPSAMADDSAEDGGALLVAGWPGALGLLVLAGASLWWIHRPKPD